MIPLVKMVRGLVQLADDKDIERFRKDKVKKAEEERHAVATHD